MKFDSLIILSVMVLSPGQALFGQACSVPDPVPPFQASAGKRIAAEFKESINTNHNETQHLNNRRATAHLRASAAPDGAETGTAPAQSAPKEQHAPVPQTFAVETYMRRAYNYLDTMADEAGRPYFNIFWFQGGKPAQANHDENDSPDVTSRQWQAAILARHMTGQQCRNENVWAKTILAQLDPKTGLLDPSINLASDGHNAMVLYALAIAWADSKDPVYRDAACRMIAQLPGVKPKTKWQAVAIKSIMTWVRLSNDMPGLEYAGTMARDVLNGFGTANHFGGHMHCGLRALSGVVDYALYVKDEAMLARVDALYRDARSKGTRFGWLPENAPSAGSPERDQVGCETCALMDFVALATSLANNGHPEYWGDIERMLRNQLAENQVADGSWLKPGDKPDTQRDTWRDVGPRMVGGWAGWSSPTHIWSNGSGSEPTTSGGYRAFQNCCGGSGDTALFTAWKNASLIENGVLTVNMHFDKLLPQAEIRCHQPYQGYLSVSLKEACKVRVRVPDFVEAKEVKVSSNKGEVKAVVENGYLELGPRQAGEKIEVTYPVPVKQEEIVVGNPGHKQYHYRVMWKGDTVVRMTPIGEQYKTIHSGWKKDPFETEAYYGEEGPGRLYQREYMLSGVVPHPSPLCMDDGRLNFWVNHAK